MNKNNHKEKSNNEKGNLKQIESINYLQRIKSSYILKKILENIHKYKALDIIKYNKHLQKRFNLTLDDYIEFSAIIIELIPYENKYGEFIHIINKEQTQFYHIYFNNNNKEIKRFNITKEDNVKKIKILINYEVESFYQLFSYCECIESISFVNFNRKNITNMSFMFYKSSSIKKIHFTKFITDNVIDMRCMFYDCSSLKKLNLSQFNTERVNNMSYMFFGCSSLKKIKISNFNTEEVTNMSEMFSGCSALEQLDVSKFIINEKECNSSDMFKGCSNELKYKVRRQNRHIKIVDDISQYL